MNQLPIWRLHLLRAVYLMLALGGFSISWAAILDPTSRWELMHGVVVSMLGSLSLLALLGLRYPLQMLPLLFWETIWKGIWLLRMAWPLWRAGELDAASSANVFNCALVIVVVAAIPWRYVYAQYVRQDGAPWRGGGTHA